MINKYILSPKGDDKNRVSLVQKYRLGDRNMEEGKVGESILPN